MAVTLDAPKAGVAEELVYSFPIHKFFRDEDGDLIVEGVATDGTVDHDDQIVLPSWSGPALKTWAETGANVRMSHDPRRPVGKGLRVDLDKNGDGKHWVRSVVVDKDAQRLIEKGVLTAYSIGIGHPVVQRDPTGKARGGIIAGGEIMELSIVDRPSCKNAYLQVAKAAPDGTAEFVGKLFAPDDLLTKDAPAAKAPKTVDVTLPRNMSLSVKPSDLAKLAGLKQKLEAQRARPVLSVPEALKAAGRDPRPGELTVTVPTDGELAAAARDAVEARFEVIKAAEAGIYKRDIDAATRQRLASEGNALEDGSYPIENAGDLANAATLARSGHGNVKAAKRLIARRAKELGVANPLKGGKTKQAEPETGKKMKVMCPSCGAKQNRKHAACSECGRPLANAMAAKNHDFVCLGCGKDPLDKGEKFCPGCGRENPGYNPMADQKIPANTKTADPAVTKAKSKPKKGKKGKPFGGAQAPPFGKEKEDADGDGDEGKDTKPKAKKSAGRVIEKKKKGKGKKASPAAAGGVPGSHTEPVPEHREPDGGAAIDGGEMQTSVPVMAHTGKATADPEMAASLALKALGVPADLGALHALTCPAYDPATVAKAFPHATFHGISEAFWQQEALSKAASAPLGEATQAMDLWNAARALKQADPYLTQDLREAAHKAFRDANPGPSSFPTPGELSPQRFQRPYISEGHAAASPGHDAPHSVRLPQSGGIAASNFQRGFLQDGRAADGPANQHTPGPVSPPASTGAPTHDPAQGYVTNAARDSVTHAIGALHDHIGRIFPDVCPMNPGDNDFRHPVPSPTGGVTPAPGARKAAKAAAKKAAAKAKRKAAKAKAKKAARRRAVGQPVMTVKAAGHTAEAVPGVPDITEAIKDAVAPLAAALEKANRRAARAEKTARTASKTLSAQGKALRKVRKTADAIASQPDTSQAPYRGTALTKTSAPPAVDMPTPSRAAEQAQLSKMQLLHEQWLTNPDPGLREAAYRELTAQLGISPNTAPQYTPLRQ